MFRSLATSLLAVVMGLGLSGCGGGGSESASGTPRANLYLTDAINTNYDHVWATVTKVDLVGSSGTATTVYTAGTAGGQVVDLLSLHDTTSQKYLLLTAFAAPAGIFTGVNVTVSSSLSIVPKGVTTAVTASFAGSSGSTTVLSAKFATPQNAASTKNLVVDFNLANWNLNGNTVSAPNNNYLQCGPPNGPIDPGHIVGGDYFGFVTGLAGTSPDFTLTLGSDLAVTSNQDVTISTNASTVLYNSDGSPNPTLANGEMVTVAGTYDSANNILVATAIIIQVGGLPPPPAGVIGTVTADSLSTNTITMTIDGCGGFEPPSTSITVNVSASTTFIDVSGVTDTEAEFFAALTAGSSEIQVQGTLTGSTIDAVSVQLIPTVSGGSPGGGGNGGPGQSHKVDVEGPVSNIDVSTQSFSVSVAMWTGGWQTPNAVLSVKTSTLTTYQVNDAAADAATFFGAVASGASVDVRGVLDPKTSTIAARSVRLLPTVQGLLKAGQQSANPLR
ncbi:MAG: DUF4382 domain-containing protein [Fimbriimonas sp.]|nr:DUF4382 domain-containing protein [Fimbriimonas sp.]